MLIQGDPPVAGRISRKLNAFGGERNMKKLGAFISAVATPLPLWLGETIMNAAKLTPAR
jgi:hypothetical protein